MENVNTTQPSIHEKHRVNRKIQQPFSLKPNIKGFEGLAGGKFNFQEQEMPLEVTSEHVLSWYQQLHVSDMMVEMIGATV